MTDPLFPVILHHTASNRFRRPIEASDLFLLDDQHRRVNQWDAIGYHGLLGPSGQVVLNTARFKSGSVCKFAPAMGAHARGQNDCLGLALHGDFTGATQQQVFGYRAALVKALLLSFGHSVLSIGRTYFSAAVMPHYWFGRTECPAAGDQLCGVYRFEDVYVHDGDSRLHCRYRFGFQLSEQFSIEAASEMFEQSSSANGCVVSFDANMDGLCWLAGSA